MELSPEHRTTLHVLAFLFFRMGRLQSAGRIYAALAALAALNAIPPQTAAPSPQAATQPDWRPLSGLAAVAIEQEDGETALAHIRAAMNAAHFPPDAPENAVLTLMQAKALWLCGNKDEARAAATALVYPNAEKATS